MLIRLKSVNFGRLFFQCCKAILWENGLSGLGGSERIFFDFLLQIQALGSKNPFQSAQSAQSVLPLYRFFPKRKLLTNYFTNQLLMKRFRNVDFGFRNVPRRTLRFRIVDFGFWNVPRRTLRFRILDFGFRVGKC
jgi:hypothetical protein